MKAKEIKNMAMKIAKFEKIIQASADPETRRSAEEAIIKLTGSVKSFEDMILIDELVQEILSKNS